MSPEWRGDALAFLHSLTAAEQERLRIYTTTYGLDRCCMLAQNAEKRPILSPDDKTLNTIIKHVRLLYVPNLAQPRWWSATELLLTQGFPVSPVVLTAKNASDLTCSAFGRPRKGRTLSAMRCQAGNSMNVNVVGVFLIFSLAFTNRPDVSPMLATMARSRLL